MTRGKPKLQGLPATYAENADEADTLTLVLEDAAAGLRAQIIYTVFGELNAITRSVRMENVGANPLKLDRAFYRDSERPILVNNWEATY